MVANNFMANKTPASLQVNKANHPCGIVSFARIWVKFTYKILLRQE